MSIRSTEFIDDAVRDNEATNAQEIKATGWAFGQLSDMEAWYQDLRTLPEVGNQKIDITGYSLGGYLAAEFNLLHQDGVATTIILSSSQWYCGQAANIFLEDHRPCAAAWSATPDGRASFT